MEVSLLRHPGDPLARAELGLEGLRASGAARMQAAAASLRETADELEKGARRLMKEVAAPQNG